MSTGLTVKIFGPYYLHEQLNSGGMAEIWHVTNSDGQPFALRKLLREYRFNLTARRRFIRGCEILAKIQPHEFIIRYIEHGAIRTTPYVVMEYVESSNLKELCTFDSELLTEFVGNILIDSAIALKHMHDQGFMHLDVKPENILVTRNGNVRLIDFDLSLPIGKPIKMSRIPGTAAYMAPEQLQSKPFDHRADIFAFGVMAYEILTQKRPFPSESVTEVMQLQINRSMRALRDVNPDIPASLEKIVLRCLELDPGNRYQDMSFLVHDLEQVLYVK